MSARTQYDSAKLGKVFDNVDALNAVNIHDVQYDVKKDLLRVSFVYNRKFNMYSGYFVGLCEKNGGTRTTNNGKEIVDLLFEANDSLLGPNQRVTRV